MDTTRKLFFTFAHMKDKRAQNEMNCFQNSCPTVFPVTQLLARIKAELVCINDSLFTIQWIKNTKLFQIAFDRPATMRCVLPIELRVS